MKKISMFIGIIAVLGGGFFYFYYQVYVFQGSDSRERVFEIKKGEGVREVAKKLENEQFISEDAYFLFYIWFHHLREKIIAGNYIINRTMTIPEISRFITLEGNTLPGYVSVTFPEGWDSKKMAERLSANGFDGEEFSRLVSNPKDIKDEYGFLRDSSAQSLEGYLFPDTYFFYKDSDARHIIKKMLDNFDKKLEAGLKEEIHRQNKTIREILTMASILEMEVRSQEDREVVSGIFWNRIKIGQPLQSDITLTYVLGIKKKQYSLDDTRVSSPYNTYIHAGLPPGPISDPGLSAMRAAVYPAQTEYLYFLSDQETGKTVFAKTFEEHKINKARHGL